MSAVGLFVGSIHVYRSKIWGYTKTKEIERTHLTFLKRLLQYLKPYNMCVLFSRYTLCLKLLLTKLYNLLKANHVYLCELCVCVRVPLGFMVSSNVFHFLLTDTFV